MTLSQHLIQGTPQWRAFRNEHVTGTDASVIYGVNPWESITEIYLDKVEKRIREKTNPDIERGRELEPVARDVFEKLTDYLMVPKVVLHPTIDYMMASLDGMEISGKAILEIKCPRKHPECVLDGEVPAYHMPQLQHQMITTGLKKAYYFSYTPSSYKLLEVYLDEEYAKDLLKKEADFWHCVLTKTEPKQTKTHVQMTSQEWKNAANQYRDINRQLKDLEKRKLPIKNSLLAMANGIQVEGEGITISKILRKGQLDVEALLANPKIKALIESKEINLDEYKKPSKEEWRIT